MKLLLLFTLLCMPLKNFAFSWIEIGGDSESVYIKANSIQEDQGFVFYSSLLNMTSMGLNSAIVENKADCSKEKVVELSIAYYGQPMGQGELIEEQSLNKIEYPEPNSAKYAVMKFACKKKNRK